MPNQNEEAWWREITRKEFFIPFDLTNLQGNQIQRELERVMTIVLAESARRERARIKEEVKKMKDERKNTYKSVLEKIEDEVFKAAIDNEGEAVNDEYNAILSLLSPNDTKV